MENYKNNPPQFPLIVKDALVIINHMLSDVLKDKQTNNQQFTTLSHILRSIVNNSFWGGIHLNDRVKEESIRYCLNHVTDEDLNKYWQNVGQNKKPPIIRSINHDIYLNVKFYKEQLPQDIVTIRGVLQDLKCDQQDIGLFCNNIRAISEILILDGNKLSGDYCQIPIDEQKKITQDNINNKSNEPIRFKPKTTMINEKMYYSLASLFVIGSIGLTWYLKRKENKE
jgi:hypothetical protein